MKHTDLGNDGNWNALYKCAAAAALLIVLVGIMDVVMSMTAGDAKVNSFVDVKDWFALFVSNPVSALSNLGLINIITVSLSIPVFLSLQHVHRRINPAFATLAAALFFLGAAVYISSNTVFAMQALSVQYASAAGSQKPLLEAAGRAALAQGADLTPGTFMGLTFVQLGGFIMAWVVQRSGLFGRWTGWIGLLGYICMLVFFPLAAFSPARFDSAVLISMVGGLALMAYYILLARRLFQPAGLLASAGAK